MIRDGTANTVMYGWTEEGSRRGRSQKSWINGVEGDLHAMQVRNGRHVVLESVRWIL